jgi:hypothetical protein
MLIIRRSNFINTASGIITLCKWLLGAQAKRGLVNAQAKRGMVGLNPESDDTRYCINTI